MPEYVDVAVPVGVRKTFAYSVPPHLGGKLTLGMRVLVPFGRKLITGYIVGTLKLEEIGNFKLRPVQQLLESEAAIPASLVEIALWVARYYFAPPGEVFRALFPAGTQVSGAQRVSLASKAANLIHGGFKPAGLGAQEYALLETLAREGPMTVSELGKRSGVRGAEAHVECLAAAQWLETEMFLDRPRVGSKEQLGIRLLPGSGQEIGLTSAQKRLCGALEPGSGPVPLQEFLRTSGSTLSVARTLERRAIIELAPIRIQRTPIELIKTAEQNALVLTSGQRALLDQLIPIVQSRQAARCLIHGVTGSGKTEVYLRLIAEILNQGETALFLVPEIGLTPLLSRLVVSRFPGLVSLLHSGMSSGERYDQWCRIREGYSRVVVGTRSAVFAPLQNLRLIVIDEEQDPSYKQDESPCYHAREVAWQRVRQTDGLLLLGSATPSIETFHAATQEPGIGLFRLPERIEARPLPQIKIVDMSAEFQRHGKNIVISETLRQELVNCMGRGEQAIVLLNRRGFSRTLLCRSCGHVFTCPDCSVSMTYHQLENRLVCHYCGLEKETPSFCTNCGGPYIHYAGVGTEQLEHMLQVLLPRARIARLDRDTTRRRGTLRSTLFSFAERQLDVLVGTQMLAKGHDFPDVTMVGVIAADAGLSFPDFRSAERTFQLLTQVAGRAGRGTAPGKVVIQCFYPSNYALQFAQKQDYQGFYRQEIDFRRLMGYPPYLNLIQILITDADAAKAAQRADKIAITLKQHVFGMESAVRPVVLGPASAPLEKLRGQYRMQILIKFRSAEKTLPVLQDCFDELTRHKIPLKNVHVDVDPLTLL
jgi:primosomal protein N' (replication factor Y) (superfamily II helicase)